MKRTNRSTAGTSFHNITVTTTVNKLIQAIGEPDYEDNLGDDKVNFEWECGLDTGEVFTIYDWKEYREIDRDESIEFHIGSNTSAISRQALRELNEKLNLI